MSRPRAEPTGDTDPGSVEALRTTLAEAADAERAAGMRRYMRNRFEFLGVATPERRRRCRPFLAAHRGASIATVLDRVDECWSRPERELQYCATDLLVAHAVRLEPHHLDAVRRAIEQRSWWDTVDALASRAVGPLVLHHRELASEMDRWIDDADIWVARSALLHQLHFGAQTDRDQLFEHCARRARDDDFFIRKAVGWALRQYARTDPDGVREFVAAHTDSLSQLSRREALKHLS